MGEGLKKDQLSRPVTRLPLQLELNRLALGLSNVGPVIERLCTRIAGIDKKRIEVFLR